MQRDLLPEAELRAAAKRLAPLAEDPDDDDAPVTEEWLRAVGANLSSPKLDGPPVWAAIGSTGTSLMFSRVGGRRIAALGSNPNTEKTG